MSTACARDDDGGGGEEGDGWAGAEIYVGRPEIGIALGAGLLQTVNTKEWT